MKEEVITGCNKEQEWLLSWWWSHYSEHNNYPVAFLDFGMSEKAKAWCQERGRLITPQLPFDPYDKAPTCQQTIDLWEGFYSKDVWIARKAWLQKPFGLFHAQADWNLWVDLDCEIMGSLSHIFAASQENVDIAIVEEPEKTSYNSGVILFPKNSPIITAWMEEVYHNSDLYPGDQDALYAALQKKEYKIGILPPEYNWLASQDINLYALIFHWAGTGKTYLARGASLSREIKAFKILFSA